jgi:hypothetical protein
VNSPLPPEPHLGGSSIRTRNVGKAVKLAPTGPAVESSEVAEYTCQEARSLRSRRGTALQHCDVVRQPPPSPPSSIVIDSRWFAKLSHGFEKCYTFAVAACLRQARAALMAGRVKWPVPPLEASVQAGEAPHQRHSRAAEQEEGTVNHANPCPGRPRL